MKNRKKNTLVKYICIIIVLFYVAYILINQQLTLNDYTKTSDNLSEQIEAQIANKEDLQKEKENIDSLEFIEKMAREKLDMYYPNEKIYIDNGK